MDQAMEFTKKYGKIIAGVAIAGMVTAIGIAVLRSNKSDVYLEIIESPDVNLEDI
jgi:hypothetical protein